MLIQKDGPYLAMAVLCERVLQEKDNVLSAIRIIDKIIHTVTSPESLEIMSPVALNIFALISFKSGEYGGKYKLKILPSTPSGEQMADISGPIVLEEKGKTANVIISLNLQLKEEGLSWFDILLNDE